MYLNFYGLRKQPFHVTPDPEFLYLSRSHKEALAAIIYGIAEKKGFVAITGPVGVGKTTILRSYLEGADKDKLRIVYIFNAELTFDGLLRTIYHELGIQLEATDVVEMVNRLYGYLIEQYKQGKTVVLVVDEAQNMPIETLESLRMISNLETSRDKLIQIVLVGQPEFDEKLSTTRLRQLKQRVAVRATIVPFSMEESLDYIKFRLQRAGADASSVFSSGAMKRIVEKARGIPRIINVLCDNALISGFGYTKKPVTKSVVEEIIRDFQALKQIRSRRWLPLTAAAAVLILLAIGAASYLPQYRDELLAAVRWARPGQEPKALEQGPKSAEPLSGAPGERAIAPVSGDKALPSSETSSSPGITKTVTRGDTLLHLVKEVYGVGERDPRVGKLIELVRQNNPQIRNTNVIIADQQISFPKPPAGLQTSGLRDKESVENRRR